MKKEKSMNRRDKVNYYLDIAETVSDRGTCIRRNYGAILVKNDEIIATGYVGAPRERKNCIDLNTCVREEMKIPRGTMYERCRSVHAEANAIISAFRKDMLGGTLYLVGREKNTGSYVENADSCTMCKRMIINAGIKQVLIRDTKDEYRSINVSDWILSDDSLQGDFTY